MVVVWCLLERTGSGCNWYTGDVFLNLLHLMFGLSNFEDSKFCV